MRLPALASVALATIVVAGCAATSPAPSTGQTPAPPTPVIPVESPSTDPTADGAYWLRLSTTQAIPPLDRFMVGPTAIITGDSQYLVPGAVPAIFPGPLVFPSFASEVSEDGKAQILAWAEELGLLNGQADFTGNGAIPGGVTGVVELTVDGSRITFRGIPDSTEGGDPGSPASFAEFWRRVSSLPQTLAGELGPEQPWTPDGYAILVGPPPQPQAGIPGTIADWPLDTAIGEFGVEVADGYRCGTVYGDDAATLAPALGAANQLTQWTQDPTTSASFGLTVRAIAFDEDPCAEVFGTGS
jgi:hypothetical protein